MAVGSAYMVLTVCGNFLNVKKKEKLLLVNSGRLALDSQQTFESSVAFLPLDFAHQRHKFSSIQTALFSLLVLS
jgi:hypothetical protein